MLSLIHLLDDEKCFKVVRELRWPDGVNCPHCHAPPVVKQGQDDTQRFRQRYRCLNCQRKFDDLTGTVFAGHHQPLRQWVACLYLMGLIPTPIEWLYKPFNPSGASRRETGSGRGVGRSVVFRSVNETNGIRMHLSNRQIAHELGLNEDDAEDMTRSLRQGVVDASTTPTLAGTLEIDEVYLIAGRKGQSDLVKKNPVQDADGD